MKPVLILGATSTIAQATIHKLAEQNFDLILTGRHLGDLNDIKNDLEIRYNINVFIELFDALEFTEHDTFFNDIIKKHNGISGAILMYGAMEDQKEAEKRFDKARHMIDVNYTSAVSILNIIANYFENEKRGFICAVSSVAGDRGRQSNYIYGSTKAGLSVYMEGLRNRLHKSNVHVMTIKPGMVDTKMTFGVVEQSPLLAKPEDVATDIVKGIEKKKNVLYTPWFWLIIMLVIKLIPEFIFKRTDI